MVDVFYSCQDTLCKALLTERVQLYITGTNLLPRRAVTLAPLIFPAVTLVLLIGYFLMFLTVQSVRQLRTAGISTGFLWFSWHRVHFLLGMKKAANQLFTDLRLAVYLFFHSTIIAHFILYYTVFYCIVLCGMEIFLRASRCSL